MKATQTNPEQLQKVVRKEKKKNWCEELSSMEKSLVPWENIHRWSRNLSTFKLRRITNVEIGYSHDGEAIVGSRKP